MASLQLRLEVPLGDYFINEYYFMKVLLSCTECDFEEWGTSEGELMNKIKMWNHVKRAHIGMADRILRMYNTVPSHMYRMQYSGN